jgi:hypothetical protein
VVVSAANANDSTMFEAVLDDLPPIRMPAGGGDVGRPRSMPTRPTIIAAAAPTFAGEAFGHGSPGA